MSEPRSFTQAILISFRLQGKKIPADLFKLIHSELFVWGKPFFQHYKGGIYQRLHTEYECYDAGLDEPFEKPKVAYLHWFPHKKQVWFRDEPEFFGDLCEGGITRFLPIDKSLVVTPEDMVKLKEVIEGELK